MIHGLPVIGTLISFVMSFFCAIVFCPIWSHLGPYYFDFLPQRWVEIPFWDTVGLFMLAPIFSWLLGCVTPKLVRVHNNQENKNAD